MHFLKFIKILIILVFAILQTSIVFPQVNTIFEKEINILLKFLDSNVAHLDSADKTFNLFILGDFSDSSTYKAMNRILNILITKDYMRNTYIKSLQVVMKDYHSIYSKKDLDAQFFIIVPSDNLPLNEILKYCVNNRILSTSLVPDYVEKGISVGIELKDSFNPQIIVNLEQFILEGGRIDAEIFQHVKIYSEK
jgi:hypothetical protein